MPTMMPYPISGGSPVPEKMISETFRWVTNTFVKDWVVFHSFEISDSSRISFVLLDKTNLSVICLEVVSEPTGLVEPSGAPITPVSISEAVMEDLRKQFPAYLDDDSPLALGHAVVYPSRTQYEAVELPEHLKPIFPEAEVLPGHYILQTGFNVTCDPLDPNKLGETLADYALGLRKWDKTTDENDWNNAQHKMSELRDEFEAKYNIGATFMKPSTIFSTNFDTLNRELLRLTLEQFKSLERMDNDEYNQRCVIDGAAGTGKTVLAKELARRRAEKHNETVALLCSNTNLSRHFERWAEKISNNTNGEIIAGTPATLPLSIFRDNDDLKNKYTEILKESSNLEETLRLGAIDNGWHHFIRDAINDLQEDGFSNYFDYLIVDEAQNLCTPVFLELMEVLLKNGLRNGRWSMFGDFTNQNLVTLNRVQKWNDVLEEFSPKGEWSYDKLITNCRNTHEIADAVSGLSRIKSHSMSGVHGPDVQIEYFEGQNELESQLDNSISTWKAKGLESRQIILLSSGTGDEFGSFQSNYGGWKLYNISEVPELEPSTPSNILRYSDVYDFQGLESDLVILVIYRTDDQVTLEETVLIDNEKHLNRILYIGASRAKTMLIVLVDKDWKNTIDDRIKTWEIEKLLLQDVV